MKDAKCCIPVIIAGLVVLIVGCMNPPKLQTMVNGKPTGHPSYVWLAALSVLTGLVVCWMVDGAKGYEMV